MTPRPPPFPTFEVGKPLREELTADKLQAMAQAILFEVIGGSADFVPGKGTSLKINRRRQPESRCYVIATSGSTSLPATIGLTTIDYDVAAARTASLLGTLAAGVFTFYKPGLYKTHYAASIEFDLSGATTATPPPVSAQANLLIGGATLASSRSDSSHPATPNFDLFVTNPDGTIVQSVDLDGATGKTEAITVSSVAPCEATGTGTADEYGNVSITLNSSCTDVLSAAELDGSNKLDVTLDDADLDVTSSLTVITGSTPSGLGYGTLTGQALIRVIRNSSGDIKILDGVTERAPTVEIYATVANGVATCLTATLSLLKL